MMVRYLSNVDRSLGFRIFYPEEVNNVQYQEFSCRFETFGLKNNITGRSVGIDAIDALINAMMRIDMFLKASDEFKSGAIHWAGGCAPDDFGLPWQAVKPYLV